MTNRYKISKNRQGSGGFLCPPGHPFHVYTAVGMEGSREVAWGSLDMILNDPDAEPKVRARAQEIMDAAQLTCSEAWIRQVYGYFRNCYAPESGSRNVSECVVRRKDGPAIPDARHLAVLTVRQYFPDAAPRPELIADPGNGYGTRKCAKCGQTVQYEARFNAFAVYGRGPGCPEGAQHDPGTSYPLAS
jgi:hypothetical protein